MRHLCALKLEWTRMVCNVPGIVLQYVKAMRPYKQVVLLQMDASLHQLAGVSCRITNKHEKKSIG